MRTSRWRSRCRPAVSGAGAPATRSPEVKPASCRSALGDRGHSRSLSLGLRVAPVAPVAGASAVASRAGESNHRNRGEPRQRTLAPAIPTNTVVWSRYALLSPDPAEHSAGAVAHHSIISSGPVSRATWIATLSGRSQTGQYSQACVPTHPRARHRCRAEGHELAQRQGRQPRCVVARMRIVCNRRLLLVQLASCLRYCPPASLPSSMPAGLDRQCVASPARGGPEADTQSKRERKLDAPDTPDSRGAARR